MNNTNNIHTSPAELGADAVEVAGVGARVAEVALVVLLGLLVAPPLLTIAVVVAAPVIAVAVLVAVAVAAIAGPAILVRRILAHHQAHGSTMFLHRLQR